MKPIKICLVRVWWSKLMLECKPTAWGMRWNWSEPNFIRSEPFHTKCTLSTKTNQIRKVDLK